MTDTDETERTTDDESTPGPSDGPWGFQLYRDTAGEWRWRFVVPNGNIVAESGEGYQRRAGALNGIDALQREIDDAILSDLTEPQDDESRSRRLKRRFNDLADKTRGRLRADDGDAGDGDA